jgi:hypothetical protein
VVAQAEDGGKFENRKGENIGPMLPPDPNGGDAVLMGLPVSEFENP